MITLDHPFMRDDFSFERDHYPIVRHLMRQGFVMVPDWMPVGWPTYDWVYPNQIDAMMRPSPRLRDRIRWQLTSFLTPECVKRWRTKRWLDAVLQDIKRSCDNGQG